jgi:hypothetical protein
MFAYELHKIRSAELIREAEAYRLRRAAVRARRAAGTADTEHEPEGGVPEDDRGPRRSWFGRAA